MTFEPEIEFLLSKFSHELRNPLTTLYSTIQLIEMQHPEVKEYRHWDSIADDIEYMNQLLDELSSFSKSERLNLETFDLRSFLEKITLSFAASISQSEVKYTSKIDPTLTEMNADPTKLREVLLNLLKNAYEAAMPNNTVSFEAVSEGTNLVITVQDTGCGISEEQLPTIFDPFVTYKKDGTGLGLAICNHIVKAHGGTISVTSSLGIGTTFRIVLPTTQKRN